MVKLQDEPIGDPVCFPLYYVSKLARDNEVVVCQVGEGADELFLGYPHWKMVLKYQNIADTFLPNFLLKIVVKILNFFGINKDWRFEALRRVSLGQPIYWGPEPYPHLEKMQILSPRLKKLFENTTSWEAIRPIHENFMAKSKERSNLNWMSYVDLNLRLPELLLMRVDKMSMGASLEARVPFLDHKFVEYSMSIPSKIKTRNKELKYILKKAVRGIIPDTIIDRKKQGFSVPIEEWSHSALSVFGEDQLREFCNKTDLLDWEVVKSYLSSNKGLEWWPLLNLAMWWSIYIKQADS